MVWRGYLTNRGGEWVKGKKEKVHRDLHSKGKEEEKRQGSIWPIVVRSYFWVIREAEGRMDCRDWRERHCIVLLTELLNITFVSPWRRLRSTVPLRGIDEMILLIWVSTIGITSIRVASVSIAVLRWSIIVVLTVSLRRRRRRNVPILIAHLTWIWSSVPRRFASSFTSSTSTEDASSNTI